MPFWNWFGFGRKKPPVVPPPVTRTVRVSVWGVNGLVLDATGLLVLDQDTVTVMTGTNTAGRLAFVTTAPSTQSGWFTLGAPGYESRNAHALLTDDLDLDLVPTAPPGRTDVRLVNRSWEDSTGSFRPLGTTLFWALGGWHRGEQQRVRDHFAFLEEQSIDYWRGLGQVNWKGEAIDPFHPDYPRELAEVIDAAYDEYGRLTQLTAIGGGCKDPVAAARIMAGVIQPRRHKILMLEAVNEGNASEAHAKAVARVFAGLGLPFGVGLGDQGIADIEDASDDTGSTLAFFHTERTKGDNGARQVRQCWDFKAFRRASVHNEPPGPASSVAEFTDPFKLAAMRAAGIICGAGAFCFHTGAGVFGRRMVTTSGLLREADLWDVPAITTMLEAIRHADRHLPAGIESWTKFNTNQPIKGVTGSINKLYGARAGNQFAEIAIGCESPTNTFEAKEACDLSIVNPATGDRTDRSLSKGDRVEVGGSWAYLLIGTTR